MKTSEQLGSAGGAVAGGTAGWMATEGKPLPQRLLATAAGAVFGGGAGLVATKAVNATERAVGQGLVSAGQRVEDCGSRTQNYRTLGAGLAVEQTGHFLVRNSER